MGRFYRVLLRAYPAAFREEFGAEMEAAYAECAAREVGRTRFGHVIAPALAFADTLRHAFAVRAEARRASRLDRRRLDLALHGAGHQPTRGPRMTQIGQDMKYALRVLAKDRSFTATVLLTLAICIAANAAIFSIVESVVLRPLPVPEAHRLVHVSNSYPKAGAVRASNGIPDYFDRLEGVKAFEELAIYQRSSATVGFDNGAERMPGMRVTPSLLRILRAQPVLGAIFQEADTEPGNEFKVLIGHGLWQTRFGGRPDIVGADMRINGRQYTITGVMPPDFHYLSSTIALWMPLSFTPDQKSDQNRHNNSYSMVGQLRPGATVGQVQQQLDAINRANDERFPHFRQILADAGFHTVAVSLQDDLVREIRPVLFLLWGGVLFVLLIGAVNITNLVIVRSSARQRDLATRHAVGASIGRLASQLVTETLILSLVGGLIGLALGRWALALVPALGLDELPRGHEIRMEPATMAIVLGLSLLVGVLVSLVPVARVWRLNLNLALRDEGRGGTAGRGAMFTRRALATAQVALAFLLLIGAGLLFTSFRKVLGVDPGFTVEGVVSGSVALPRARYADDDAMRSFTDRAMERLRAIPGIEAAGVSDTLPFTGDFSDSVILAEGYVMRPGESLISPTRASVSPGYFETMKVRLVAGRLFDARDTATATPQVIIVDRKLARKFWGDSDPIGRRMFSPGSAEELLKPGPNSRYFTVVGVVDDVKTHGLDAEEQRVGAYYWPLAQSPSSGLWFVARTGLSAEVASDAIRRELAAVDPELPFFDVQSMSTRMDESLVSRRMPMLLALAFGAVALFLSAVGIYGVLAYQVAQRSREIGIRMALGSSVRAVFGLVLGDGLKIVATGLVLGFLGALATGRYIETQLFGVNTLDPVVIMSVAAILAAVSFVAVSIPARRAAKVNPVIALGGS